MNFYYCSSFLIVGFALGAMKWVVRACFLGGRAGTNRQPFCIEADTLFGF